MNKLLLYRQSVEPRPFERDCVRERGGGRCSFLKNLGEKRERVEERQKEKKNQRIFDWNHYQKGEDGIWEERGAGERSGID
jgi:hypothetical protein